MTILIILSLCLISAVIVFTAPTIHSKIINTTIATKVDNTVSEIKEPNAFIPSTMEPKKDIKLLFTGDVMLGRGIQEDILKGIDPFQYVKTTFSNNDLTISNLECVITNAGIANANKEYVLKADPKVLNTVKNAGISAVSLANNHTMDYGVQGIVDMMNNLNNSNIPYFGAGKSIDYAFTPLIKDINGTKIAFFGFNDIETFITAATINTAGNASIRKTEDEQKMIQVIEDIRPKVDYIIPFMHWGNEYNTQTTSRQQYLAHELIDAGADIVIGSHPHVTETIENYKGKNIIYSLGNFVFDQMSGEPNATQGAMAQLDITNQISLKIIPVVLNASGFPKLK